MATISIVDAPEIAEYPLLIPQGVYVSRFLTLVDDTGAIRDTTNYTAVGVVVPDYGQPAQLTLQTNPAPGGGTGNGRITMGIVGTAPNQYDVAVTITEADSAAMTMTGIGIFQLDIFDASGRRFLRLEGPAALDRKVTP